MEALLTEENIKLLLILFGCGFVAIFILALTNKVVIFEDGSDLMVTLGMIIYPSIGFICLVFLQPSESSPDYDIFMGSTAGIIVTGFTCLLFLYCLIKTFTNSISSNGLGIGILIGLFRIISSFIIIFSIVGYINKLTEDNKSLGSTLIFITIFTAIFGWILKVLINGEKVALKRLGT
jgi:hypothetical protein